MADIVSEMEAPNATFRSKANAIDMWGNTALHYAASKGDISEVSRLIKDGANCNAISLDGSTAMHCAAARNCAAIVELLMQRGASPGVMDKHGRSPLALAVQLGHMDLAKNTFLRAERRANPDSPSAEERRANRTPGQALPPHSSSSAASLRVAGMLGGDAADMMAGADGNPSDSMEDFLAIRKQLVFEEGSTLASSSAASVTGAGAASTSTLAAADGDVFDIAEETGEDLEEGAGWVPKERQIYTTSSRFSLRRDAPSPDLHNGGGGAGAGQQNYRPRGMSGYSVPTACKVDLKAIARAKAVCEAGDMRVLKVIVENDLELVGKCDAEGNSLIHICAALDKETLVKFLLAAGCHPCCRNHRGETALHIAAANGHYQLVHTFVSDFGAPNLLIRDVNGCNPLHAAVSAGENAIVELIIDCAADDPVRGNAVLTALDVQYRSPADLAVALNNRNAASMLLQAASWHQNYARGRGFVSDKMANIQVQRNTEEGLGNLTDEQVERQQANNNVRGFGKVTDHQKTSLLALMRKDGSAAAAQEYISLNGMPNTVASSFTAKTPVHLCAEAGSHGGVLALLNANGDPNQLCRWKFWGTKRATSPLHLAVESGSIKTITTLLDGGADINFANKTTGDNALHMAIGYGRARILAVLLKYSADPFVQNKLKMNAIAVANKHQHPECMSLLEPAAFEALAWSSDADALFACVKENAGLAEPGIAPLPEKTLVAKLLQLEAFLVVVYQAIPRSVEITPVHAGHQAFIDEALSTYEAWEDSQKMVVPDSTDGNFHARAAVARGAIRGLLDATIALMQILEGQIEAPIDKLKKGGKKTMRCYRYILNLYKVRPTPERKLTDTEKYAVVQKVKKGDMTMAEAESILEAAKRADEVDASVAMVEAAEVVKRANWKKWLKLGKVKGKGKGDLAAGTSAQRQRLLARGVEPGMRPRRSASNASSSSAAGDTGESDDHRGLDTDGEDENEYGYGGGAEFARSRLPSSSRSSAASIDDKYVIVDAIDSDARPRVQPGLQPLPPSATEPHQEHQSAAAAAFAVAVAAENGSTGAGAVDAGGASASAAHAAGDLVGPPADGEAAAVAQDGLLSRFGAKTAWGTTLTAHDSDDDGNADLPAGWSQAPISTDKPSKDSNFYENSRGFVHRVPSITSAAAAGGGFGSFDAVVSATNERGIKLAKSRDHADQDVELTDSELLAQVLQRVQIKQAEEEDSLKVQDERAAANRKEKELEAAAAAAAAAVEEGQRAPIVQAAAEARAAQEARAAAQAQEALEERRRHHRQLEQRDEEAAEQARKVLRMQRQMYDAAEEKLRAKADVAEKVVTEAAAAAAGGAKDGSGSGDPLVVWLEAAKQADVDPVPAVDSGSLPLVDTDAGPAEDGSSVEGELHQDDEIDIKTIGNTAHLVADALESFKVLSEISGKIPTSASNAGAFAAPASVTAAVAEEGAEEGAEESGVIVEAESSPAPEMAAGDDGGDDEGNPFAAAFVNSSGGGDVETGTAEENPFVATDDFSEDEFETNNEEWMASTAFSTPTSALPTEVNANDDVEAAGVQSAVEAAPASAGANAVDDAAQQAAEEMVEEMTAGVAEELAEEAALETVAAETEAMIAAETKAAEEAKATAEAAAAAAAADTDAKAAAEVVDAKAAADAEDAAVHAKVAADAKIAEEAEKADVANAEAERLRLEVAKLTAQLESKTTSPPTPPSSSEPTASPALADAGNVGTRFRTLSSNELQTIVLSDDDSLASGQSSPARSVSGSAADVVDLSSLVAAGGEEDAEQQRSSVAERKLKKKKNKKKKREEKRKRIAAVESLAATDKDSSSGGSGSSSSDKGRRSRSSSKSSSKQRTSLSVSASESDVASEVGSPLPTPEPHALDGSGAGAAVVGETSATSAAAVSEDPNVMLEFVGYWGDTSRQLKISRVAENRDDFMVEWVGSAHFDPSTITCMGGKPAAGQGLQFDVHSKVGRSEWVLRLDIHAGLPVQHITGNAKNTRGDAATCSLRRYASADELPAMGKRGKRAALLNMATSGLKGLAKSKMKQIASLEVLKRKDGSAGRVDSKTVPNCVGMHMVRRPGEGLGLAVHAVKGEVGIRVAQVWPNTVADGAGVKVEMVLVRVSGQDMLNCTYEEIVVALKEAASTFEIVVCNPADIAEAIKQREMQKAMKGAPAWWGPAGESRPRSASQSGSGAGAAAGDWPRSKSSSAGSSASAAAPVSMMAGIPADAPTGPAAEPDTASVPLTASSMPIVKCFHQVMPSDSFVGLSFKYGVSVDTLRKCNKMSQSDQLFSRKRLMIPEKDV